MTIQECIAFLQQHDRFLILSHVRPDGDTLGSAGALCSALRRAGKTACMFPNPEITEKYLPYVQDDLAPGDYRYETVISVDTAEEGMFPKGYEGPTPELAIDHHGSNSGYAPLRIVRPECAACGEIILEVIEALNGGLSKEEADLLYIALSTDTGCFQYMNTNAHTLRAAAKLVDYGAENGLLNNIFFRSIPRSRILLESMVYQQMRFFREGKIAFAVITQSMIDASGVTENDMDDLANLASRPEGVIVSVTVKEKSPTECKISMRSKPEVNVSDICAHFGGGGHAMAAGCKIEADGETAVERILAVINEVWPE